MVHIRRTLPRPVLALLCDRDGTLVDDVPYNAEPRALRLRAGVADALGRARAAGLRIGIVTNQSGVARGRIRPDELAAVHARLVELLGPIDVIASCPHHPDAGCSCRKPEPGLVLDAAAALGVAPTSCVVIGDRVHDVIAADRAGACGILVSGGGRACDDDHAWAASFGDAVDMVLEAM
jgi:histidinol-phosphate phosphatase family protein